MKLALFDLHCDTACEMLAQRQPLERNTLAVSLENASRFDPYFQVMAFWTDRRLNDEEGWLRFLELRENLLRDPAVTSGRVRCVTECPGSGGGTSLLFGVEDARIFAGKRERVAEAFRLGVRILTPLWAGETCIGGSHDTDAGLTAFGKQAIGDAVSMGMIPDISHASVRSADEIFAIAADRQAPVIASHSNAKAVCDVSRNLSDRQISAILASGGVIGLNFYVRFLNSDPTRARMEDVLPHMEHFLSLGAEDALCLGGDWDGAKMPPELRTVGDLTLLADLLLKRNYPEALVRNIFYNNAYRFASRWLTK